jgi:hypothetical protein
MRSGKPGICFAHEMVETNSLSMSSLRKEIDLDPDEEVGDPFGVGGGDDAEDEKTGVVEGVRVDDCDNE